MARMRGRLTWRDVRSVRDLVSKRAEPFEDTIFEHALSERRCQRKYNFPRYEQLDGCVDTMAIDYLGTYS